MVVFEIMDVMAEASLGTCVRWISSSRVPSRLSVTIKYRKTAWPNHGNFRTIIILLQHTFHKQRTLNIKDKKKSTATINSTTATMIILYSKADEGVDDNEN